MTAWNALVCHGRVKAGDAVVMQGTGGVSLFALQFARMHGARCIITSSSDEKLELARGMGADETINYRRDPDWGKAVQAATYGRGADIVVEVGGAGTLEKSLEAVRTGGSVQLIGVLTGVIGQIPTAAILRRAITVQGIYVGSRELLASVFEGVLSEGIPDRLKRTVVSSTSAGRQTARR